MYKAGETVVFRRSMYDPTMAVVIEDQSSDEDLVEVFIGSMHDYEALEAAYEYAGWGSDVVSIKNDERSWSAYPTELEPVGIPNFENKSRTIPECGVWGCSTCDS